jgi:starch synthase
MVDDNEYQKPFSTKFADKLRLEGVTNTDVRSIAGFPIGYEELMRLAVDYSDAIVYASEKVNQRVANYAETKGKPILPYEGADDLNEVCKRQWEFYQTLQEPKNE